ncbi:hypothetical protein [Tenacibaculum agarivorans]|uniref:hypothetical protein n=1 Tax=Tenacibaculum agarivorans TaxID=1908389 RepID=UPI000A835717|nr:hypothetical protein [Tenacibaculum agarivorans]
MKTIKNLNGVKILSKKELNEIHGSLTVYRPYCKGTNMCCVRTSQGEEFCDFGYCINRRCIWA